MLALFSAPFKAVRNAALLLTATAVAACAPVAGGGPSINTRAPVPVALLVPFGSENGAETALAQSLENAARLAIADLQDVEIDLKVYPTAGNPEQAAAQAKTAAGDGAKIILGPVFGAAANAAGLAVRPNGLNVLSFSNNADIAGGNVFVLGNTFENTAQRVVSYAASTSAEPLTVLTVHPNTTAGIVARDAVGKAIATSNVASAGSTAYEASQQGIVQAIPGIAGSTRSANANAIFFTADTLGGLPLLSQLLPENGIDPQAVQFMGLTRWDLPAQTLDLPGLQNGLFALPDPTLSAQFQSRYTSAYGGPPHPIAGLAYDGIAAIGALVKTAQSEALTGRALTQDAGFAGVNGVFRLRSDGTNERALAVARIVDRQVQIISPAPTSFGSAGF